MSQSYNNHDKFKEINITSNEKSGGVSNELSTKLEPVNNSNSDLTIDAQKCETHKIMCNGCGTQGEEVKTFKRCSACKSVLYCGSRCQTRHWKKHKVLCAAIHQLTKDMESKIEEACSFESHLAPKQKEKIASVIGQRCMIDCMIGGQKVKGLWNTGSQVALL